MPQKQSPELIKDLGSVEHGETDEEFSSIEIPTIKIPKIEIPKIEIPTISFSKLATNWKKIYNKNCILWILLSKEKSKWRSENMPIFWKVELYPKVLYNYQLLIADVYLL